MPQLIDFHLWEKLQKSVKPLDKKSVQKEVPLRLKIRQVIHPPLSNKLDLHHKTIAEAYDNSVDFIRKHFEKGTKKIQIITGKGHLTEGAICREFKGWLETPAFQKYIHEHSWTNDGGAIWIFLRKRK